MLLVLALLAFQTPADSTTAYLDPGARDLVRRARARRAATTAGITAYRAVVHERISLGLRALRRDRVFYRRDLAGRIAWHRDGPDTITMLGAREAIPVVFSKVTLPEDLRSDAPDLAFDPVGERIELGGGEGRDSTFIYHPLAAGSEANYRYQSGDTTTITLPDGRVVRLAELRVIPRRDEFRLMAGSFWIDLAGDEVVRAVFRPARPFDFERDLDPADRKDADRHIPGFLKPIRGEVRYITIEYALWENRWWLPRLLAMDAVASAGTMLSAPLRYEREYSEMEVEGDTTPGAAAAALAARTTRHHRRPHRMRDSSAVADSAADSAVVWDSFAVILPPDSLALITSPVFATDLLSEGESVLSRSEARDLAAELRLLPQAPWQAHAPTLKLGLGGAGLVRYNRVEALSLGARYQFDLGRLSLDLTGRLGVADLEPNAELGIARETPDVRLRLAGYRRLAVANPATRALGVGNSLGALLLGRDDGAYFRAAGAEFTAQPAATAPQAFSWRVYAERQRGARKETDASFAHLLRSGHVFSENIPAAPADEVGAALTLHGERGKNPAGVRVGADLGMDAAVGTYPFARLSLTTRLAFPLPGHLLGAVEGAAGTSEGSPPAQSLWYLGGPATLRGYGGLAASGETFWRGRAEVANAFPAARIALFSDVGWAGPGTAFARGRPLLSAGIGGSFFDGLLRVDLARALRAPKGWRMDFYVDGIL
jgi:hypothetical protein